MRHIKTATTLLGVLLILTLGAAPVFAGRITISSLPYTFHQSSHSSDAIDTLVLAGTKLSSSGNGITLQCDYGDPVHDILIDLGNDTLSYGEGGGRSYGIQFSGTSSYYVYNVEVRGGHILHGTSSSSANGCNALRVSGHDILIKDVHATVAGQNGIVLFSDGEQTYNDRIEGGRFRSDVMRFDSRCNYDAPVVKFSNCYSSAITTYGGDYHWEVNGLTIEDGPHMGIAALGRETDGNYAKVIIHDCNITTDARNLTYSSYDGTCHSAANPYGIAVRHTYAGTKIYNNTITSGTQYGGNRGIIIEYSNGNAAEPVEVYNNYIDVHEGPNVEYGENLPVHGIRIRYAPRYLHVYDNTIICTGDNDPSTTSMGNQVIAFRYSWGITGTHNVFERNLIRARALAPGVETIGIVTEGDDVPSPPEDPTLVIRYNRIESNGMCVKFSQDNGGCPGVNMEGDTIAFIAPDYGWETFHVGHLGNNWNCADNSVCDMVYVNGASDDDIVMANGGTLELSVKRTLNITVKGANNLPVPSASVSVTNNYGNMVLQGTTGAGGTFAGPVTYLWSSRSYDSSSFNNFTIKAWKAGDSVTQAYNVTATSGGPTITMSTVGTPDTIPPDPVFDLGAVGGADDGTIMLSWTAPGEDADQGIAAAYEIRYSLNQITDVNWSQATEISNEPQPSTAGTQQGVTISGLTPGSYYYIGLKTIDANDNPSDLSNIAGAEARLNIITGDDDAIVQLAAPRNDSIVNTSKPTLVVLNAGNSGDQYFFEVAADSSFVTLAAASDAVTQESGTTTAWQVSTQLQTGQRYCWRARLNDNAYSTVMSFMVKPEAHAYPNPFMANAQAAVTFTEIPAGASLTVMTMSGNVVRRWANLTGEDVEWDGTNESGHPVASGTYLWYIENSDTKGKLVVVR